MVVALQVAVRVQPLGPDAVLGLGVGEEAPARKLEKRTRTVSSRLSGRCGRCPGAGSAPAGCCRGPRRRGRVEHVPVWIPLLRGRLLTLPLGSAAGVLAVVAAVGGRGGVGGGGVGVGGGGGGSPVVRWGQPVVSPVVSPVVVSAAVALVAVAASGASWAPAARPRRPGPRRSAPRARRRPMEPASRNGVGDGTRTRWLPPCQESSRGAGMPGGCRRTAMTVSQPCISCWWYLQ